jgi:WD40 repeat protein
MALVRNPAPLRGVQSWTIETQGHRGEVRSIAYSPDGEWMATGAEDGTIRVFDPKTGKFVKALVGHDAAVESVSWAPPPRPNRPETDSEPRTVVQK